MSAQGFPEITPVPSTDSTDDDGPLDFASSDKKSLSSTAATGDASKTPTAAITKASAGSKPPPSLPNTTTTTASRTTSANNQGEAVSVERKEELLLEARVNRLQWIQRVPLPYRRAESATDPWQQEPALATFVKSCHAAAMMPTVTQVLSQLYGVDEHRMTAEEMAQRLQGLLGSVEDDKSLNFVRPGRQTLEAEVAKHPDDPVLEGYRDFWMKLQTPECASLVQGMRNTLRNLEVGDEPKSVEEIAGRLKHYIETTHVALTVHSAWRKVGVKDRVKNAMESFLYGQCHTLLQFTLWDESTKKAEQAWIERLAALEFVTPTHLDIPCLEGEDLDSVLADPMEALKSVDLYYSPYEKLQRILHLYHGVNKALTTALNRSKGESEKLPSADDVLPTIILTVLRARPERMVVNLRMVELFCPQEYLRGEAGYAFTNLYGAVHFLQDLDMEEPKSLSISPEEFRKGLEESRKKFQERLEAKKTQHHQSQVPQVDTEIQLKFVDIPAQEIRAARQEGEVVDLDWALRWQRERLGEQEATSAAGQSTSQERSSTADDSLPPGFSRNYSFLTSRPEDIRMSDLPQLLAEYRMLVHTSETLLGERTSRLAAERKKKVNLVQEELLANARKVDPSLLPGSSSQS